MTPNATKNRWYLSPMADGNPAPKPRPGPMAFRAESKVTSQKGPPASNAGGIGESQLTRETPTGSKELKIVPLWVWLVLGIISIPLGILVSTPLLYVGIALVVGVPLISRGNRIQTRIRREFDQRQH